MTNTKKFFKDVGFMGLSKIFLSLQGFLLIPLFTKFMSPEDYGIWSQIKITLLLLGGFSLLGLESAIIRFISGETNKKTQSKHLITAITIALAAAALFAAITFIFSNPIANLLTQTQGTGFFFKFISILLITRVLHALFAALFRAKERVKEYSIIESLKALVEIIIAFVLLNQGFTILAAIIAFGLAELFAIILYIARNNKEIHLTKPNKLSAKELLNFSLPFTIAPALFWILQTGDQYVLGAIHGAAQVGIYAVAYSLSRMVRIVADPILLTMLPTMTSAYNRGDQDTLHRIFGYSYRAIFMLTIPALVGISILAKPILTIISETSYAQEPMLLAIISLGVLIYLYFSLASHFLHLTKELGKISKVLIFLAIGNIVLNLILVPTLKSYGAAIATLITFASAGVYGMRIIKNMGLSLMPKKLLTYSIAAAIMGAIAYGIRSFPYGTSIQKLMIILIVSPVIYFTILVLIKEITKTEIEFAKSLLKKNNK